MLKLKKILDEDHFLGKRIFSKLCLWENLGLASYLVNKLTFEILERGEIPSYDVIASNIFTESSSPIRVFSRMGV